MHEATSSQYAQKSADYFQGARADFVARLPVNEHGHILEIGCSSGGTGALALSEGKCDEYTGIELVEEVAEVAREKLTRVITTDLETDFPDFPEASFDVLIASEIFEHLREPWKVIDRIMPLLKPGAIVLASSPNVAFKGIIVNLIKGKFDYEDMGVMDRTHLRWFTPDSYAALFSGAGLDVRDCWPIAPVKPKHKILARFLPNGQRSFWRQICIEARKPL